MSEFLVSVLEITDLKPIDGADFIELAQVAGYEAVVSKGKYKVGDYALYIPEQSLLPEDLMEELGLTGKLSGKDKNRVKAIRLKGQVSQGIVCRPSLMGRIWKYKWLARRVCKKQKNYASLLGITKWVPVVPAQMRGKIVPAPSIVNWIEIENIKRHPDMFEEGEEVIATEKVHGTCCLVTYDPSRNLIFVSSKGISKQALGYDANEPNLYWRIVFQDAVDRFISWIATIHVDKVIGVFGEIYGPGVQDLTYLRTSARFMLFEIKIDGRWLSRYECEELCQWYKRKAGVEIEMTPIVYKGPWHYGILRDLAEEDSSLCITHPHIREGLVVKPLRERLSDNGNRAIAKIVSDRYLFRGGKVTEYE